MTKAVSIVALAMLIAAANAVAAEYRVAPDGDDAHPGTRSQPFRSLAKALAATRSAGDAENTILIAPGNYFCEDAIRLDERDSGLTIQGEAPGAAAQIHGGVPVTGWEPWQGQVWRAPVPKGERFFNLVVDSAPAVMARHPNLGSGFEGGFKKMDNTTLLVPPEFRALDYSDAQVPTFIGANWFAEVREVLSANPDSDGRLKVDGGSGLFGGMNHRFAVCGVLEFLDEPGEWCLKHQEGYLYFWPPKGTPGDHVIVRTTTQRLIDIRGTGMASPARNIRIENLSLIGSDFCARWYLFKDREDNSTPEPLQHGLVFAENVDGMKVRNCRIMAAGHSGVWLNRYAQNCAVENCLITGAGYCGVYANGFMPGEGPFTSAADSYVNKGHRIENNFVYDCGKFVGAGSGIQFYQSGDSVIARNEIGQMPRYGITVKGQRSRQLPAQMYGQEITFENHAGFIHARNLTISGNEIYSVCRNSFDFGGIESWGPGRDNVWEYNHLHDIDQALIWDGWAHVLFADDASHGLLIRGNIMHHCQGGRATGAWMQKSLDQTAENNLVVDCVLGRVVTLKTNMEPAGNRIVRHNIIASDSNGPRYSVINSLKTVQEVNGNWITPFNPENPNPYASMKLDLDSTFAPAPLERTKPDWEMTAADYRMVNPPDWFKPIDTSLIGLRKDFAFDKLAVTRRQATGKIQAEDYQRMRDLRTTAGLGISNIAPGAWAKYANLDFGPGKAGRAIFAMTTEAPDLKNDLRFVRHYGQEAVESLPFTRDKYGALILRWETSKPYSAKGKKGADLFDEKFAPETDPKAGDWFPMLAPPTSTRGLTSSPGTVDFDILNEEGLQDSCAYARVSFHAQVARSTMILNVASGAGIKVWLNGEEVISARQCPADGLARKDCPVVAGWNTILVKANQGIEAGSLWFRLHMTIPNNGRVFMIPGLPAEKRMTASAEGNLVELRLGSPKGDLLGAVPSGMTECPLAKVTGIHDLYLVFPGDRVKAVDWVSFEEQ